jgi:hypothetical protein
MTEKETKFLKTLLDFDDVLHNARVEFMLSNGTALGAHREKTFIPHDHDIDVASFKPNYKRVVQVALPNFAVVARYPKNTTWENTTEVTFVHRETQVRIDLFRFHTNADGTLGAYTYCGICDDKPGGRCEWRFANDISPLEFLGHTFNVMGEEYLASTYGPDWKVVHKYTYHEGIDCGYYKAICN